MPTTRPTSAAGPRPERQPQVRLALERLRATNRVRLGIAITLFAVAVLVGLLSDPGALSLPAFLTLSGICLLYATLTTRLLVQWEQREDVPWADIALVSNLLAALDIFVLVVATHFGGGLESPASAALIIALVIHGMALPTTAAYLQAAWASLLYVGMVSAEILGLVAPVSLGVAGEALRGNALPAGIVCGLVTGLNFLSVLIATRVSAELRSREEEATLAARQHGELAEQLGAANSALASSQERYRSILESASDAILACDAHGVITSANGAAERVFGWLRQELTGQSLKEIFGAQTADLRAGFQQATQETPSVQHEIQGRSRTGQLRTVDVLAQPLCDGQHDAGFQIICRDVTDRREVAEVRTQFLATLTHDIKNPLQAIFGYTEMLLERPGLPEDVLGLLHRIDASAQDIYQLVVNFLEMARMEAGKFALHRCASDFNEVVERVIQRHRSAAYVRSIDLQVDLADRLDSVEIDAVQVDRVLSNLLSNAIKYTPPGGSVRVETAPSADGVMLRVSDTGPGIPQGAQSALFTSYRRLEDTAQAEGSGLGLWVVKTLVDAHGGTVHVHSSPGEGATFLVELPGRAGGGAHLSPH